MPVKPKKTKQKQKQKQSQRVVVNINTGRATARRRAPARRSGGGGGSVGGGGGGGAFYTPIYTNAPSDLAPIIHNLPAQYQHLPAITMPTNTAPQPSLQALTYPTPTTLQAPTEDVRPLGGSAQSIASSIIPASIDTGPPRRPPAQLAELKSRLEKGTGLKAIAEEPSASSKKGSPLIEQLRLAQASPKLGLRGTGLTTEIGSNIPKSGNLSPFQTELRESISRRQSRETSPSSFFSGTNPMLGAGVRAPSGLRGFGLQPDFFERTSPLSSVNEPIGKVRVTKNLNKEQQKEAKKAYDKNRYEQKKMGPG